MKTTSRKTAKSNAAPKARPAGSRKKSIRTSRLLQPKISPARNHNQMLVRG